MSHQSSPNQSQEFLPTRQRVYMACTHCRKRKVRCITTEESYDKPCERCVRRGFKCEYVPVSAPPQSPAPRRDPRAPSYMSNPSNQPTTHGYEASSSRPAHRSRPHSR
ncbi:hypothetical protein B0H11DRAFT_2189440, partial [Mycena galericulata]